MARKLRKLKMTYFQKINIYFFYYVIVVKMPLKLLKPANLKGAPANSNRFNALQLSHGLLITMGMRQGWQMGEATHSHHLDQPVKVYRAENTRPRVVPSFPRFHW